MRNRIGFDARKLADFGIGTYISSLLEGLSQLDGDELYIVFAHADARLPQLLRGGCERWRSRLREVVERVQRHGTRPVLCGRRHRGAVIG